MDISHKRKALEDVRGWAAKGAARDAGNRHGVMLPEDSDFPEPMPEAPPEEGEAFPSEPTVEDIDGATVTAEPEGIDVEALLALQTEEA